MSNIIRWSPMFPDFFEDMLGSVGQRGVISPALDVYQTDIEVKVEMPLANIDPSAVDIEVVNDVLTISGKSEHKSEVDEKHYYRREVRTGAFQRSVVLPAHVDSDAATATYDNGMLVVTLPKKSAPSGKKIAISTK